MGVLYNNVYIQIKAGAVQVKIRWARIYIVLMAGGRPTGTRSPCQHGRLVVASYSMWGYTSHSRSSGTVGRMRELRGGSGMFTSPLKIL